MALLRPPAPRELFAWLDDAAHTYVNELTKHRHYSRDVY